MWRDHEIKIYFVLSDFDQDMIAFVHYNSMDYQYTVYSC